MKNFVKIIVLAAVFCLVASCENSIGKKNLEPNDNDQNDSEISDEDNDTGDTETPDEGDTEGPTDQDDGKFPDEDDTSDTTDEEEIVVEGYKSPYGSIAMTFSGTIGSKEYPASFDDKFAEGSWGNNANPIIPEYAEKVYTNTYLLTDYIQFQQTPIYTDETLGNPVIFFYLPIENAEGGIYSINYNGDTSVVVVDVDWETEAIQCYHAFGEGELEISDAEINNDPNNPFNTINFNGNATLYHPTNYKGEDISSEFSQIFTGTATLCEPVD